MEHESTILGVMISLSVASTCKMLFSCALSILTELRNPRGYRGSVYFIVVHNIAFVLEKFGFTKFHKAATSTGPKTSPLPSQYTVPKISLAHKRLAPMNST